MSQTAGSGTGYEPDAEAVAKGTAIYTPRTLRLYDFVVHGLSNRFAWGCPTNALIGQYRDHISDNHLEAGVGTGFFLDRLGERSFRRLTLLDINPSCLALSAERLRRYSPELVEASLFAPLPSDTPYDSIGLTYVLHCLPGAMPEKLQVIDNLRPVMHAGTVLFGATILGSGIAPNPAAKALMGAYNRRGVFDNLQDDMAALAEGLRARFGQVSVSRRGCVALFQASGPVSPDAA
ncbi:class I SAM-dependent methyltransferase [Methyloligella sp. 2.7D]|uniref:class I SAM-dependent methyltransferase n=1 Tax=unclassified Methyloligella TaxID=2625955 RepID=UPI00157DD49B|nr:class I SAM-dependent methyltransferase [Methyloligella sp. GL2]QKP77052.1 class I SAM-dependent methyltransferase [Methyloligella sp. GL2]